METAVPFPSPFARLYLAARVKLGNDLPQKIPVEVGIDFGGGDAGVAQHFLHGAQVGPAFYEVRGEGVAQRVRADGFAQAGLLGQLS